MRNDPVAGAALPTRFAVFLVGLVLLVSVEGCGAPGPEGQRTGASANEKDPSARVELVPGDGQNASGSAAFSKVPDAVEVELRMDGLPEPGAVYVARVRGGTCAGDRGAERRGAGGHGGGGHEQGHEDGGAHGMRAGVTEFPLSLVRADSGGRGTSATLLRGVSVEGLFSGKPRHVDVQASGGGEAGELACADLERRPG